MFWCLHAFLPYVRPGAELVYTTKLSVVYHGDVFPSPPDQRTRLVIFGDSKTLSGFDTDLFDRLSKGRTLSYNLGLPEKSHFVQELAALVNRGQAPNVVLLTVPWAAQPSPAWWQRLRDDEWLRRELAPFYQFPRNCALFAAGSRRYGGVAAAYRHGQEEVATMLQQRGYYFISGSSHYPNHQLPEDFRDPSDRPDVVWTRAADPQSVYCSVLVRLAREHGLRFLFVPSHFRRGARPEPPPRNDLLARSIAAYPEFQVVGPEYWLYPNKCYADVVHLNLDGAKAYTTDLWTLLAPGLSSSAGDQTGPRPSAP